MDTSRDYSQVVAPKYGLPSRLVHAIVRTESAGNRFAHRCEPSYRYLWDVRANAPYQVDSRAVAKRLPPPGFPAPAGISKATEWLDQQSSWGLMQVMGAVAREYGFTGFLCGLCDPLEGLHYGCKLLAARRDKYLSASGWSGVIASYNAGHPDTSAGNEYVYRVVQAGDVQSVAELVA